MSLEQRIQEALGAAPASIGPLSGGCVGEVYKVRLADGEVVVAKVDNQPEPTLAVEAYMLTYLAQRSDLPVPAVLYSEPRLLLLEFMPGQSHFPGEVQAHAAELLAALHNITAPAYGLERATLIGGLHQPNPWTERWLDFFAEQRLLHMANEAAAAGRLPMALLGRIERLCGRLDRWLAEPDQPALIHGDAWSGNMLSADKLITAFLDPAIYYADPEIELAFTTLFGTFGAPFFARYEALRPLAPDFFEVRRDLYNLYPLLVHVRLFGGSYLGSVEQTLRRLGC